MTSMIDPSDRFIILSPGWGLDARCVYDKECIMLYLAKPCHPAMPVAIGEKICVNASG